jgi:hypothetical protein
MHVQERHYLVQKDWLLAGSAPALWQTDDWRRMESTFRGPGALIPWFHCSTTTHVIRSLALHAELCGNVLPSEYDVRVLNFPTLQL